MGKKSPNSSVILLTERRLNGKDDRCKTGDNDKSVLLKMEPLSEIGDRDTSANLTIGNWDEEL